MIDSTVPRIDGCYGLLLIVQLLSGCYGLLLIVQYNFFPDVTDCY